MLTATQIRMAIQKAKVCKDVDAIKEDTSFIDLGLDSLDMFSVILELQKVLGREIPDDDIDRLDSIQAVLEYAAEEEQASVS